jgi:hypothetical protein
MSDVIRAYGGAVGTTTYRCAQSAALACSGWMMRAPTRGKNSTPRTVGDMML